MIVVNNYGLKPAIRFPLQRWTAETLESLFSLSRFNIP